MNALKTAYVFFSTFERYTAAAIIGEGGAGRVFHATDSEGGKWAIKWLDPSKASSEKTKRFKNELQFCLRHEHPNIVRVEDHGRFEKEGQSSPFYVMQLYDGSLRDLIKAGMNPSDALRYFTQILDGVEAAHLSGVVHRDLKPENILYCKREDSLVVADFGIASFRREDLYTAVETQDSTRLANFQYAAPEQRQRGVKCNHLADIFALGLMLNEMFTGQVPIGTQYRKIDGVSADHGYLDEFVDLMIRSQPSDRPESIERVKHELIRRGNDFVTTQRLSALKNTVVPQSELDDPLVLDPPKLFSVEWDHDQLTLKLSREVNQKWVWALHHMGSHSSVMGKGPEHFDIRGNQARIAA